MFEQVAITGVVGMAGTLGLQLFQRKRKNEDTPSPTGANNFELRSRILAKHDQLGQLRGDWDTVMKCGLTASALMTEQVTVKAYNTPISELRELMKRIATRHVLVCDQDDRLIGVVSDRDIHERTGKSAQDVMTPEPYSVAPNSSVGKALSLMLNRRISCVPVVDCGHICGVITTTDLLMALECLLEICEERFGLPTLCQ